MTFRDCIKLNHFQRLRQFTSKQGKKQQILYKRCEQNDFNSVNLLPGTGRTTELSGDLIARPVTRTISIMHAFQTINNQAQFKLVYHQLIVITSKEPVCPRVELILKIIIILLIIFLGFIKSKPC